jgi:hypothetical protein
MEKRADISKRFNFAADGCHQHRNPDRHYLLCPIRDATLYTVSKIEKE